MNEGKTCPGCGADNLHDSAYCRGCGRKFTACPGCGTFNTSAVMYCVKCGARLPSSSARTSSAASSEEPYLVWEGFPFSVLRRTTMTKTQWRVEKILISILVAILVLILVASLAATSISGDVPCLIGAELLVFVVFILIYYKAGREQAEEEASKGRRE